VINTIKQIFPIGLGTFGVGANASEKDVKSTKNNLSGQLDSLLYAFSLGQNYIETSYHYAKGDTLRFLSQFFKRIPRNKIFITTKLHAPIKNQKNVSDQLTQALQLMGLNYVDSLSCTPIAASQLPLEEVYSYMFEEINKGKTRFFSGSNLNLPRLNLLNNKGFKLFSMEGLYNLECKINEDLGIIQYCHSHTILFAAYQPLRRNRTLKQNYPILIELSKKYNKTQNQIILNWILKHKNIFILNKSTNKKHIEENIESLDFQMKDNDYFKLDKFRKKEFDEIPIDWDNKGGTPVYKLPNMLP